VPLHLTLAVELAATDTPVIPDTFILAVLIASVFMTIKFIKRTFGAMIE